MIEFLVAVVAFVFGLGFIVMLHEAGHFYFAKKAGILCSEFAIGMGPIVYRVKKGETYYTIRALPIGGFVSMAGEDLNESLVKVGTSISLQIENNMITQIILDDKIDGNIKGDVISCDLYGKDTKELYIELEVNNEVVKYTLSDECFYVISQKQKILVAPYDRCFESKTLMQRFLTIIAGPMMNLVLALFLFLFVGLASGVATNENVIGTISTNTAQEYLEEGDIITEINGYTITNWEDIGIAMGKTQSEGLEYIPMTIIRNDEQISFDVKSTVQVNSIGITNINDIDNEIGVGVLVGEIASGNKAAEAGLQKHDVILGFTIDGNYTAVNSWYEIITYFEELSVGKIKIKYVREDVESETKEVEIFSKDTLSKLGMEDISYTIGISPTTKFSFFGGITNGFSLTLSNATMIFTTLGMVLNPSAQISVSDLSGPVGIFGLVQTYVSAGVVTYISLLGMLSVNFFVVNLLPFPALDGGRLVFLGYEAITKKPVDKKVENMINTIGFVLLMGLMLFVTFNDFLRLKND